MRAIGAVVVSRMMRALAVAFGIEGADFVGYGA
jgi:hypothetical protein